jgi:hypothetical protein
MDCLQKKGKTKSSSEKTAEVLIGLKFSLFANLLSNALVVFLCV